MVSEVRVTTVCSPTVKLSQDSVSFSYAIGCPLGNRTSTRPILKGRRDPHTIIQIRNHIIQLKRKVTKTNDTSTIVVVLKIIKREFICLFILFGRLVENE